MPRKRRGHAWIRRCKSTHELSVFKLNSWSFFLAVAPYDSERIRSSHNESYAAHASIAHQRNGRPRTVRVLKLRALKV